MKNKTFRKNNISFAILLMCPLALSAQVDICSDQSYEIMNVVPVTAGGVEVMYRWLENGQVVAGASADSYTVLAGKAEGVYTYVREAKTDECDA
jgi:hypothetical protein